MIAKVQLLLEAEPVYKAKRTSSQSRLTHKNDILLDTLRVVNN